MDFFKKNWPFFLGLIFSLSLLWPLFVSGAYPYHDDVTYIRLYEMDKCFKDGQIPCRWVPNLGNLYGYPLFNYYAPLPYYFGELVYSLTHNLIFSVKFMFAVAFIFSYIFMFLLAKKFWGSRGGALSAIFYSFAPYHAVDFYVRGAMGEMWGLAFFPAIFWSLIRLEEKISIRNLLLVAVCLSLLITSHNLSAMIFLPSIIIWIIILFLRKKSRQFLYFSVCSFIIGLGLSAFYLIPAVLEKDLVHLETTVVGYFSYTEHFKGFKKLLSRDWGYGGSFREVPGGERDGLSYQIGWVHLLGFILSVASVKFFWKRNRFLSWIIIFSASSVLISAFMINPRSVAIWKMIEPLKYLQFPWRLLMLIIFFISLMVGSIMLIPLKYKEYLVAVLILMVVGLNFSYFKPEKFIQVSDKDLLSGVEWEKRIKRAIYDFLPKSAKEPPAELAAQRYKILTGESKITDFKEGTNWLIFSTETTSHTIIRLSQYYFPDWKILVDGKETKVEYKNNSLGLMTIILGQGSHKIEGRLYDTPVRSAANLLTILTFIFFTILFVISFKETRSLISYYRKRVN